MRLQKARKVDFISTHLKPDSRAVQKTNRAGQQLFMKQNEIKDENEFLTQCFLIVKIAKKNCQILYNIYIAKNGNILYNIGNIYSGEVFVRLFCSLTAIFPPNR